MVLSVVVIVTLITLFMLGYRVESGNIKQYALLQFGSNPSGATVEIDGEIISSKTPNKTSISPGKHEIVMWRDGYETWRKSIDIRSGTLTWLNYAILVPKDLSVESVVNYDSIHASLASPDGKEMLIQKKHELPIFEFIDLSSDKVKSKTLTIPVEFYSDANIIGKSHSFTIKKWDDAERYVLINHIFDDKNEWLVLDTQNIKLTKNITALFDINISDIVFSGSGGNLFYALVDNDIRKLDLSAGTITKPIASNVKSFNIYNHSKVLTYVGIKDKYNNITVGLYVEGDEKPSVIKTISNTNNLPIHISTTRYFNENYVAIAVGKKVEILSGSYPEPIDDKTHGLLTIASFETSKNINELSFNPSGEYVFVQSDAYFASYDLEYKKFASSNIEESPIVKSLNWLDNNYIWSDVGGKLTIREFDGSNIHTINSVLIGQDATLTSNRRFLYSINRIDSIYQLQRVRMILS